MLLEFCKSADCRILNGRVQGDKVGKATCFSAGGGSSLVDIFVASASIVKQAGKLSVSDAVPESDHRVVTLTLEVGHQRCESPDPRAPGTADAEKWSPSEYPKVREEGVPVFKSLLAQSAALHAVMEELEVVGPEEGAKMLESAVRNAALCAFPYYMQTSKTRPSMNSFLQ